MTPPAPFSTPTSSRCCFWVSFYGILKCVRVIIVRTYGLLFGWRISCKQERDSTCAYVCGVYTHIHINKLNNIVHLYTYLHPRVVVAEGAQPEGDGGGGNAQVTEG